MQVERCFALHSCFHPRGTCRQVSMMLKTHPRPSGCRQVPRQRAGCPSGNGKHAKCYVRMKLGGLLAPCIMCRTRGREPLDDKRPVAVKASWTRVEDVEGQPSRGHPTPCTQVTLHRRCVTSWTWDCSCWIGHSWASIPDCKS